MTKLTEVSYGLNFEQPLEQLLRIIATSIRESTTFQAVLISIYEPETDLLRRVTGVGFPSDTLAELLSRKQAYSSIQQMLKPQFRISRSFFIPVNEAPIIPADVHMVTLSFDDKTARTPTAWDPDDILIVPLQDTQGKPLVSSVSMPPETGCARTLARSKHWKYLPRRLRLRSRIIPDLLNCAPGLKPSPPVWKDNNA